MNRLYLGILVIVFSCNSESEKADLVENMTVVKVKPIKKRKADFTFKSKLDKAQFELLFSEFIIGSISKDTELDLLNNMLINFSFYSNYISVFLPAKRDSLKTEKEKARYILFLCLVSEASEFKNHHELNVCKEMIYDDLNPSYKGLFSYEELTYLISQNNFNILNTEDSLKFRYGRILNGYTPSTP